MVLAGMSGAGKTSCYQTLAAAYNSAQHRQWCVNVIIVMTAAYTMEEVSLTIMAEVSLSEHAHCYHSSYLVMSGQQPPKACNGLLVY